MEHILPKQQELIDKVPHAVSPHNVLLCDDGLEIMRNLLILLNAYGRKPWRPNKLDEKEILIAENDYTESLQMLMSDQNTPRAELPFSDKPQRIMTSVLGVIEEALEFYHSYKNNEEDNQLIELTDIIFFYAELMLNKGYTWDQIKSTYDKKWAENMSRYEKAEHGDYSWDKRQGGKTL